MAATGSQADLFIMPPPLIGGGIKRCLSDVCLSDWRLSVENIGPKSRTERPRKTKTVTEVAYVSRDQDTTFKVKVTRPLCLAAQITTWTTSVSTPKPTESRCLSIMNIHGAKRAGAAGVRRVYGLELGCSVYRGGVISCCFPHNLFI